MPEGGEFYAKEHGAMGGGDPVPNTRLVPQTRDRGPSIYGVAELRSVPSGYSPTIASVSAVMAGSQVVAQPCGALPSCPLDLITRVLLCSTGLPRTLAVRPAGIRQCRRSRVMVPPVAGRQETGAGASGPPDMHTCKPCMAVCAALSVTR